MVSSSSVVAVSLLVVVSLVMVGAEGVDGLSACVSTCSSVEVSKVDSSIVSLDSLSEEAAAFFCSRFF